MLDRDCPKGSIDEDGCCVGCGRSVQPEACCPDFSAPPATPAEGAREQRDELFDLYVGAISQLCWRDGGRIGHSFMSDGEAAFDYFGLGDAESVTAEAFNKAVEAKRAALVAAGGAK